MSRAKDKKIKKLKKKSIISQIVGIFVVVVVYLALAIGIFVLFNMNLMYNKVQVGYDNSVRIQHMIETVAKQDNSLKLNEMCKDALELTPNTEAICIYSSEKGEYIYKSKNDTPNLGFKYESYSSDKVMVYLTDEANSIIYASYVVETSQTADGKDEVTEENDEAVEETIEYDVEVQLETLLGDLPRIRDLANIGQLWDQSRVASIKLWYGIPSDDGNMIVYIKNDLPICATEIYITVAIFSIIGLIAVLLFGFYGVSIIRLFIERNKLSRILETDLITGGKNLQYFIRKGKAFIRRKNVKYAIVLLRLEKYRNFCSCYGVQEGEELMESVYNYMRRELRRRREVLAHGDKADFAMLLEYQSAEELDNRLLSLVDRMEKSRVHQRIYFSVGIYEVTNVDEKIRAMYNCAGIALSRLNDDSEYRLIRYDEEMKKQELWKRKVENDMDNALANKEFKVYLQPKYSTKEEVISGAEALVRWIHPTEGFVPPYRFIPLFEKNGFIIKLDDYMLKEVVKLQAKWYESGKKVVPISVNLSRAHFTRPNLVEHICEVVDKYNLPHNLIELEVTESAFFDDKVSLLSTINGLREAGFEISMDDFGSGYSSLNSLKEMPLDTLKLDAEFFRDKEFEGKGKLIVGDTIALAKKLNMKIVAEGIETREQVDFLATVDCDLIQGYYFDKPMPADEFEGKAFA